MAPRRGVDGFHDISNLTIDTSAMLSPSFDAATKMSPIGALALGRQLEAENWLMTEQLVALEMFSVGTKAPGRTHGGNVGTALRKADQRSQALAVLRDAAWARSEPSSIDESAVRLARTMLKRRHPPPTHQGRQPHSESNELGTLASKELDTSNSVGLDASKGLSGLLATALKERTEADRIIQEIETLEREKEELVQSIARVHTDCAELRLEAEQRSRMRNVKDGLVGASSPMLSELLAMRERVELRQGEVQSLRQQVQFEKGRSRAVEKLGSALSLVTDEGILKAVILRWRHAVHWKLHPRDSYDATEHKKKLGMADAEPQKQSPSAVPSIPAESGKKVPESSSAPETKEKESDKVASSGDAKDGEKSSPKPGGFAILSWFTSGGDKSAETEDASTTAPAAAAEVESSKPTSEVARVSSLPPATATAFGGTVASATARKRLQDKLKKRGGGSVRPSVGSDAGVTRVSSAAFRRSIVSVVSDRPSVAPTTSATEPGAAGFRGALAATRARQRLADKKNKKAEATSAVPDASAQPVEGSSVPESTVAPPTIAIVAEPESKLAEGEKRPSSVPKAQLGVPQLAAAVRTSSAARQRLADKKNKREGGSARPSVASIVPDVIDRPSVAASESAPSPVIVPPTIAVVAEPTPGLAQSEKPSNSAPTAQLGVPQLTAAVRTSSAARQRLQAKKNKQEAGSARPSVASAVPDVSDRPSVAASESAPSPVIVPPTIAIVAEPTPESAEAEKPSGGASTAQLGVPQLTAAVRTSSAARQRLQDKKNKRGAAG